MFRYWGFPKEKLKVLDGVNTSWTPYVLTTVAPPTMSSTYSVRNNGRVETDLRASLSEMIEVVSSIAAGTLTGTVILDARAAATAGSYAGVPHSTAGVFDADLATTDYVVFEGHMKGAQALDYKKTYDAATLRFMSPEFLTTTLLTVGINQSTETTYVHCRTGVIAAVPFFVLDAILGWPVVLYDGSWSQWGQMSANTANGGQLAAGSRWITDTLSEAPGGGQVTYNHSSSPTAYPVELLARDGSTCSATLLPDDSIIYKAGCTDITPPESDATPGNQIEDKDKAYLPE
jgi:3-mercaptopyruvate sulfurtransferase SseA